MMIACVDGELVTPDPEAPVISSFLPESGVPGSEVNIAGENFSGTPGQDSVFLNGYGAEVLSSSPTHIEFIVPDSATTGPITVIELLHGKRGISPSDYEVLASADLPEIHKVNPDSGAVGTLFQIFGKNFGASVDEVSVRIGTDTAAVSSVNDTIIEASVPIGASTGPVSVSKEGFTAVGPIFTVLDIMPEIEALKPDHGPMGTPVWIIGKHFSTIPEENSITFNGITAVVLEAYSDSLSTMVPEKATSGKVVVSVNGISAEWPLFTVDPDSPSSPVIKSINPATAVVGSSVTILGEHFSETAAGNMVSFNGVEAVVSSASSTQLEVVVPEKATTGPVYVTVGDLTSNGYDFTVETPAPIINSIDPGSGPFDTQVKIEGANFSDLAGDNKVHFNGMEAVVTSASTTSLVAIVPRGAGTGPVSVTTNGSTATGPVFTYIKSAVVDTHVGSGKQGFIDGSAENSAFNGVSRMDVNSGGEIIVADFNNHAIRIVNTKNQVSTLAGDGSPGYVNGPAASARFNQPLGVAIDQMGNIYVADVGNHVIRKISTSNEVSTYAGNGQAGFTDGSANAASFNGPSDVVVDSDGNLYVADINNHAIRKIDINGTVSTIAGSGKPGFTDSKGTAASFNLPVGLGIDSQKNLYIADLANHAIRKVDVGGNTSTVAGTGAAGDVDGSVAVASFKLPYDVDVDGSGNLYIADDKNHKIRIIRINNSVETLAGNGTEGFRNGMASEAMFDDPTGVKVINSELIYVGDTENNLIRVIRFE